METYKDVRFSVVGSGDRIIDEILELLPPEWARDKKGEEFCSREAEKGGKYHGFRHKSSGKTRAACVWIYGSAPTGYRIINIIPSDAPELSIAEYNEISDEFCRLFLRPLQEKGVLTLLEFAGEIDLKVELGQALFNLLNTFSVTANKDTGSSQSEDRRRWFAFLVAFAKTDVELSSETLRCWLIGEEWPTEIADRLAAEFEFGVGLLRSADGSE